MATQKVKDLYKRYCTEPSHAGSAAILLIRFPELREEEKPKEEEKEAPKEVPKKDGKKPKR